MRSISQERLMLTETPFQEVWNNRQNVFRINHVGRRRLGEEKKNPSGWIKGWAESQPGREKGPKQRGEGGDRREEWETCSCIAGVVGMAVSSWLSSVFGIEPDILSTFGGAPWF